MGNGVAIETEQLTKFYGSQRGVIDLDLRVEEGEVFGFLGPNGAGKTTTIRLLLDLIRPTRGRARIFGHDPRIDSVTVKGLIGYLPGELALWPNLTGRQILTYLGNLRGGADGRRIATLAERFQLDLDKKFRDYSKGNKQKVGVIQAFLAQPRLLILDEPTSGLDPLNQQEFYRLLGEARAGGGTVFLSSHVLSEAEQTCDRVGIIRAGQLVRTGAVRDLVAEKRHHVTLHLGVPAEGRIASAFGALPGVSGVESADHTLRFVLQGALDPVIKQAAPFPVLNLSSAEPSLEEAFLAYYRSSAPGDPQQATPEQDRAHVG